MTEQLRDFLYTGPSSVSLALIALLWCAASWLCWRLAQAWRLRGVRHRHVAATYVCASFVLISVCVLIARQLNPATLLLFAASLVLLATLSARALRQLLHGLLLAVEASWRAGDLVRVGGHEGTIRAFSLRYAVIEDEHGALHHIPYDDWIAQVPVRRHRAGEPWHMELEVSLAAGEGCDLLKLRQRVRHTILSSPLVCVDEPIEVMLRAAGERVVAKARFATQTPRQDAAAREDVSTRLSELGA
jgi:small-conductance mechanosensitive channel